MTPSCGACAIPRGAWSLIWITAWPPKILRQLPLRITLTRTSGCVSKALGIDPQRIVCGGDSAGANIVSSGNIVLRDTLLSGCASMQDVPLPKAQVLIYPSLDLTCSSGPSYQTYGRDYYLRTESIDHYVRLYLGTAELVDASQGVNAALSQVVNGEDPTACASGTPEAGYRYAIPLCNGVTLSPSDPLVSPLLAPDHSKMPATLMYAAEFDPLRDDCDAYAAALHKAGTGVLVNRVTKGAIHAWMNLLGRDESLITDLDQIGHDVAAALRD